MTALPEMTPEQRAEGLAKALETRQARSAAKKELAAGTLTLAAVFETEDHPLLGDRIRSVLLALPKVGAATADRLLADLRIDPRKRLSGLGSNQRQALLAELAPVPA